MIFDGVHTYMVDPMVLHDLMSIARGGGAWRLCIGLGPPGTVLNCRSGCDSTIDISLSLTEITDAALPGSCPPNFLSIPRSEHFTTTSPIKERISYASCMHPMLIIYGGVYKNWERKTPSEAASEKMRIMKRMETGLLTPEVGFWRAAMKIKVVVWWQQFR